MRNERSRRGLSRWQSMIVPIMALLCLPLSSIFAQDTWEGTLRVMFVEPTSRWQDSQGDDFQNGFLDWGLIVPVTLSDAGQWDTTFIWDPETSGYYDLVPENLMAIAALYNADGEYKDAYPPYGYYFTAYPVDATAAAMEGIPGQNQSSPDCTHRVFLEAGLNKT